MNLKEAYTLYQKNNLRHLNRQQLSVLSTLEVFIVTKFDTRVHAATLNSLEYLWAVACTMAD